MTRSEAHWPSLAAKRQSRIGPSGNSTTLSRTRSRFTATGSGTEHSLLPAAGLAGSASPPPARKFAKLWTPSVEHERASCSGSVASSLEEPCQFRARSYSLQTCEHVGHG